jgi:hypothetical protein
MRTPLSVSQALQKRLDFDYGANGRPLETGLSPEAKR